MELYYQNETLYIDVETLLNIDEVDDLKNRIFNIIDDYEIDNIIIRNKTHQLINRHYLKKIEHEYRHKYQGKLYIR